MKLYGLKRITLKQLAYQLTSIYGLDGLHCIRIVENPGPYPMLSLECFGNPNPAMTPFEGWFFAGPLLDYLAQPDDEDKSP